MPRQRERRIDNRLGYPQQQFGTASFKRWAIREQQRAHNNLDRNQAPDAVVFALTDDVAPVVQGCARA